MSLPLMNLIKPLNDDLANLGKEVTHRGLTFTKYPFPVDGAINLMTVSCNEASNAAFITSMTDGCRLDAVSLLVIKDSLGEVKVIPAKQLLTRTKGGSPLSVGAGEHFIKVAYDRDYFTVKVEEFSEQVIGYYLFGERTNTNLNHQR